MRSGHGMHAAGGGAQQLCTRQLRPCNYVLLAHSVTEHDEQSSRYLRLHSL